MTDGSGAIYKLSSNPSTIIVNKGAGPLNLQCEEPGYEPLLTSVPEQFNPVAILDILCWPTFFVDYMTGSIKQYPKNYTAIMTLRDHSL